jgi:hypothetical protein
MVSSIPGPAPSSSDADLLAACAQMVQNRQGVAAIEMLTAANRCRPTPQIEERLVSLRHEIFADLAFVSKRDAWPPDGPDMFPGSDGPPEVGVHQLTAETLRSGILDHGCLLVRGFISAERVRQLVGDIDRTFAAFDAHKAGAPTTDTTPWYLPFKALPAYQLGHGRQWVRDGGGVWTADSPRTMFDTLEAFEDIDLATPLAGYLGERPALSVKKWTLRRVPLTLGGADWHQDGAFLGAGIRTVNVWLSLSHCGDDAPGLDIVPRRLSNLVETCTEGAWFDWSVGDPIARRLAGGRVTRPIFEPGDALLFDEMFLHRTAIDEVMTRERYAIESWFFAPSNYPQEQVPLVF